MAAHGIKFSQFYAAHLCTPSRAALLTGRLPIRSGLNVVLFPNSTGGIPANEITLAERTQGAWLCNDVHRQVAPGPLACLSAHSARFRPLFRHPLQQRYGREEIRTSSDPAAARRNDRRTTGQTGNAHAALHARGPVVHPKPSRRPQESQPFFLYLAYTFPHIPLHAGKAFRGKSPRGLYGDVVEEIDWSVGQILAALRDEGMAESTLVVFTSDNGPWLIQQLQGGSAGLLREGKGSTWEGGMRVPCLAWWPGTIAAGRTALDVVSELDLVPNLSGAGRRKDS